MNTTTEEVKCENIVPISRERVMQFLKGEITCIPDYEKGDIMAIDTRTLYVNTFPLKMNERQKELCSNTVY
jgi:hypothetical protein